MRAVMARTALVAAAVIGLAMATRSLDARGVRAESAVLIGDGGACFVLDGVGRFVNAARSSAQRVEVTSDASGVRGSCTARVAPTATGERQLWGYENTGRDCTLSVNGRLLATRDWTLTVSATGEATLECAVR